MEFVLTLTCPERLGIVHAVSGFLLAHGCDIVESRQYDAERSGRLFMRVRFAARGRPVTVEELRASFAEMAARYRMDWALQRADERARVLVMVSRFGHCLNDLLYRWHAGQFNADIVAIVSNHTVFTSLAASYDVPFIHVPVTPATKPEAEARLLGLIDAYRVDLVVLARYMQVLSDEVCKRMESQVINVHHSILPSFKGAKPYHQAYARGVKLVGATAHYVTPDLDEGPIIEQEVIRVDHSLGPEGLAVAGRDAECRALARAVQWHAEHRIFLDGQRTVVFA